MPAPAAQAGRRSASASSSASARQLWWDLPLIESFELLRHIYRVPAAALSRATSADFARPARSRPVPRARRCGSSRSASACAATWRRRCCTTREIVYLDEPTIGLDVVAKQRIRDFLREINRERGVTILLTTHDMADVEQLCSRLLIIDHGTLLYDGTLDEHPRPLRHRAHAGRRPGRGRRRGGSRQVRRRRARCAPTGRAAGCASTAPTRPPPT